MIQEACTYVEKTPNLDIKLKLIDTLRTVTAGKVRTENFTGIYMYCKLLQNFLQEQAVSIFDSPNNFMTQLPVSKLANI